MSLDKKSHGDVTSWHFHTQVANASSTHLASYLLIQGVGYYDFNPIDPQGI